MAKRNLAQSILLGGGGSTANCSCILDSRAYDSIDIFITIIILEVSEIDIYELTYYIIYWFAL